MWNNQLLWIYHVTSIPSAAACFGSARHALHIGVQRKLASNLVACWDVGVDFVPPWCFEALGGAVADSISIVRDLGRAIGQPPVHLTML